MAIGNKNYCRKHYGDIIKAATANFDELAKLWPRSQRWDRIRGTYVNLGLEIHASPHTWAWHGIRLYRDGTFEPMSFYGRGCLAPHEWHPVLEGVV